MRPSSWRESAIETVSTKGKPMSRQTVQTEGKHLGLVKERESRHPERAVASNCEDAELPPLPEADEEGNRPALEYIRASIARDIIRERNTLRLTQQDLAKLAGVRHETICRLESGKH